MSKTIYFDLDGTIYDLYNIENWLEKLNNENEEVFNEGRSIVDTYDSRFTDVIFGLLNCGYTFGVISWLPMYSTPEFNEKVRQEKIKWCQKYLPFITLDNINIIPYGVPKQKAIVKKSKEMWLIDDNKEVCKVWETPKERKYKNVNESFDVIDALIEILGEECI